MLKFQHRELQVSDSDAFEDYNNYFQMLLSQRLIATSHLATYSTTVTMVSDVVTEHIHKITLMVNVLVNSPTV